MKNITKLVILAGAVVAGTVASQQANATLITGSITFTGGVTLNTGSAGTATAVTSFTNTVVLSDSGSFQTLPIAAGTAVTFAPSFAFNSGPLAALWSVDGFTFDLSSSSIFAQGGSPAGVIVDGSGTISGNGYTPTPGTWSFSVSDPGAGTPETFSFQAASGAIAPGVPDGGLTVALLGGSLIALQGVRRKLQS